MPQLLAGWFLRVEVCEQRDREHGREETGGLQAPCKLDTRISIYEEHKKENVRGSYRENHYC